MPSYKLIYFDGRGRAEVCRLLFALADQKYEDSTFTREQWPVIKPTTPFGQVPVLEIDGKPYAESVAIGSYLAREFGYYGKSNLEALEIDQVLYLLEDCMKEGIKVYFPAEGANKEELMKNFLENVIPRFMGYFEKMLKENGTGYFVGNGLTLADISVYCLVYGLSQRHPGCADSFAGVKALCDRVANNEKIKAYLATRKQTEF